MVYFKLNMLVIKQKEHLWRWFIPYSSSHTVYSIIFVCEGKILVFEEKNTKTFLHEKIKAGSESKETRVCGQTVIFERSTV